MFQLQLDEVLVDDAPFDIVSCQVNYDYHLNFQNLMRSCVVAWCWNQHLLKQLPNIQFSLNLELFMTQQCRPRDFWSYVTGFLTTLLDNGYYCNIWTQRPPGIFFSRILRMLKSPSFMLFLAYLSL